MLSWWCVDLASHALAPQEREVVGGDFAESGESGGQALRDLLGLIVRRQAALWKGPGPWVALLGLVVPLGMMLSLVSKRAAGLCAIYAWLYVNNWTAGYLAAGFRQDLVHTAAAFAFTYLTLICAAWSGGLALGFLSRRAIGINGLLFLLVLLLGTLPTPARDSGPNAPVFSLTFYRVVLPFLVLAVLVLIPAFAGMHHGLGLDGLPRLLRMVACVCTLATMLAMLAATLKPHWGGWFSVFAAVGPLGYIAVTAIWRHHGIGGVVSDEAN
jgi:hypothetical protein